MVLRPLATIINRLENLGIEGIIILKCMLEEEDVRLWTGLICLQSTEEILFTR